MANLNEADIWTEAIYQLEEDDPVLGGPNGIDNLAPKQLAGRTRFQRVRNVTPWAPELDYPAAIAYVSHAGVTWKSVAASKKVTPGTDETKWTRWGFTTAELNAALGNSVAAHEAKDDPHPKYWNDLRGNAKIAAAIAALVNSSPAALDTLAELAVALGNDANFAATVTKALALKSSLESPVFTGHPTAPTPAQFDNDTSLATTAYVLRAMGTYAINGVDTGTANTCVVAYTPAFTALVDGMVLWFKAAATNTGATTLRVNGIGAAPAAVVGAANAPLQGGEIVANGKCQVVWNANLSAWILIQCTGAAVPVGPATKPGHALQLGQATGRLLRTTIYARLAGVLSKSVDGGAYASVGDSKWTPTSGMSFVIVEAQGAGAPGAGATLPSAGNMSMGSPGGAGAYGKSIFSAAAVGASVVITVGAAGAPAVGAAGAAGGSSSFGALLSAPGGLASGVLNNFAATNNANGNSGLTAAPTGANLISIRGGCGNLSLAINVGISSGMLGGAGGASKFGVGGIGSIANSPGSAASGNWGSGGGGVVLTSAAGASCAGGAATDGVVIVQEFA